jgi:8-oxo-dGTP pyrophosphatase MutT (NUDIX family)
LTELDTRFALSDVIGRAHTRLRPLDDAEAVDLAYPAPRGDGDLEGGFRYVGTRPLRPAAVLVGLLDRDGEAHVLLTLRTAHLSSHAGQIAFPGGKVEPDDPSPCATALREAEEETGLRSRYVDLIGLLDPYVTGTGYRVVPVVASIRPGFTLSPDPGEVADVFDVPLSFLMDPANHQRHSREWQGQIRHYYAMPYFDRYIWGATAGILRNFYERLYAGEGR